MIYDFRHAEHPELDWYFYEISRNTVDEPFTVLVKNFSMAGHIQFFCDIFVSKQWDIGRSSFRSNDVNMLFELWDFFGMMKSHGPFSPILINHENFGVPPHVYRRTIEQVWTHHKTLGSIPMTSSKLCIINE